MVARCSGAGQSECSRGSAWHRLRGESVCVRRSRTPWRPLTRRWRRATISGRLWESARGGELWGANSYSPPIVHWIGIRTPQVGRSTAASADTISRYASFPSSAAPRFPDRPARPIRTAASESRTPRCRACPPSPHPLAGGPARRLRKPLRSSPARKCTTPSTPWRSLLSYSFRNCCTAKTITPPTAVIKIHFAPMRRAFAKSFLCRRYADSQTSFDSRRAS